MLLRLIKAEKVDDPPAIPNCSLPLFGSYTQDSSLAARRQQDAGDDIGVWLDGTEVQTINGYTGLSKEVASSHTLRQSVNEMLKFADARDAYSLWYSHLLNRASSNKDSEDKNAPLSAKMKLKNRRTTKQLFKFRKLIQRAQSVYDFMARGIGRDGEARRCDSHQLDSCSVLVRRLGPFSQQKINRFIHWLR